ncbi:ketoacyl-ACP synthase III [Pseudomonas palleroniana]|uniref:Beta-ketoacyl-[acyl-carrier-protein] synthase III n=1 Tax=Pseudomonas palleroniana TaxID=191390 RepID=A0A1H5P9E3_9PSED|nr:beta-ketoacyl-ACP synthase III [Pseudomonas palleroniana]KAB0563532.1 ketoacyl-ACP synthase III [Pseudomonas palleroniana]PTC25995.1 ketoacyl-ACP synthase III [Pseudomonas palleroniana]SEF09617.1 3-oxoacyl-[acyl-carrier-protein] synthase III [Pseudomonas palleroniana]
MLRAAVICGLGGYEPEAIVTNDMLAEELDTSDEWIRTRTGVGQRHIAGAHQSTGDLAIEAAARALSSAGLTQVDAVVLATATPDFSCPATAPRVAARLGMSGVMAFDISAVCTGFVYGLAVASSLITAGVVHSVLLIGADTFTRTLDPGDRSTRALFGDGAGAVVLRSGDSAEPGALLGFDLGSDGSLAGLLMTPAVTHEERANQQSTSFFSMDGRAVFNEAVNHMTESVQQILKAVGWEVRDVDRLVPHQANTRILAAVADQLDIPFERVVSNLSEVGNTVAASIPLALVYGHGAGSLQEGDRVVLTGFGAGLTWGSVALRWPRIV